ncbi:MAG: ABC transporter permease subunit [Fibrobacteraceae bacterium]|nr:ABC transporter permease subunit [Fibrobacteraceae bacterium]
MRIVISPEMKTKWVRFKKNKIAVRSFWALVIIYAFSLLSPWLVNDEPLLMRFEGKTYFPAFVTYAETEFGGTYQTEPDYLQLIAESKKEGKHVWALMPLVAHDPLKADLSDSGTPPFAPSFKHLLGTDANGRDVLARLIHGFRICMSFSLLLTLLGTFLGIVIGGIQGYLGGKWDIFMQRGIEIWSSLPFLYVVILIGSIYGRSFILLIGIMALFDWVSLSYYMRGEYLKLRSLPYVRAAKMLGMSWTHIFFKEMLPNALTPVISLFPFTLIGGIGSLTALDFLGFGLEPPTPSWGELMSQGLNNLYAPWISISTVAALFVTLLLTAFVGEGIRDAMDPKSGDRYE